MDVVASDHIITESEFNEEQLIWAQVHDELVDDSPILVCSTVTSTLLSRIIH